MRKGNNEGVGKTELGGKKGDVLEDSPAQTTGKQKKE